MGIWLVRGLVAAGVLAALVVVLADGDDRPRAVSSALSPPGGSRTFAAPSVSFASPAVPRATPYVLTGGDGGVRLAEIDASEPEPDPATGALARAITTRVCTPATRAICEARTRFGCRPLDDIGDDGDVTDTTPVDCTTLVGEQCGDWAIRQYGWMPDRLVVHERALERCLAMLRDDLVDGELHALDLACDALADDPAPYGGACTPWIACGDDGECRDGTCTPLPGRGEPCNDGACGWDLVCVAGLCDRPTPHGAACDDDSICERPEDACFDGACGTSAGHGGACEYDSECDIASRCMLGRCAPVASDACTLDEECGRGRTCVGDYAARCEGASSFGQRCVAPTDCDPWLGCIDGRCGGDVATRTGSLGLGRTCTMGLVAERCATGLVCAFGVEGYECQRGARVGEDCAEHPCVADATCMWRVVDGVCRAGLCGVTGYFAGAGEE